MILCPWLARIKSLGPSGVSSAVIVNRFLSFVSTTSLICDSVYCLNLGCFNYHISTNPFYQRVQGAVRGRQEGRSRHFEPEDQIYPNDVEEARKVVLTGLQRVNHFCGFCYDGLEDWIPFGMVWTTFGVLKMGYVGGGECLGREVSS